jgi:hypothetical protein
VPGGSSQVPPPTNSTLVTEPPLQPTVTPAQPGQAQITDYSEPYQGEYSNESVFERYTKGMLSFDNVLGLIGAGLVLPSILGLLAGQPKVNVKRPNYGPIDPVNWGGVESIDLPGVNPGYIINPAQKPFYQTTSPVQSRYAWMPRPLIETQQEISPTWLNPNQAMPKPWGLQQAQQNYDLSQVLNQINQTALDPNFVGYGQYPTQGYQPPVFNPQTAAQQASQMPVGFSQVMGPIAPT